MGCLTMCMMMRPWILMLHMNTHCIAVDGITFLAIGISIWCPA